MVRKLGSIIYFTKIIEFKEYKLSQEGNTSGLPINELYLPNLDE
jgi:hypothetical protein